MIERDFWNGMASLTRQLYQRGIRHEEYGLEISGHVWPFIQKERQICMLYLTPPNDVVGTDCIVGAGAALELPYQPHVFHWTASWGTRFQKGSILAITSPDRTEVTVVSMLRLPLRALDTAYAMIYLEELMVAHCDTAWELGTRLISPESAENEAYRGWRRVPPWGFFENRRWGGPNPNSGPGRRFTLEDIYSLMAACIPNLTISLS